MSGSEVQRPIERPVTKAALKSAAEAGYSFEVHKAIKLATTEVSLSEGVQLVNTAARAEAERWEEEAGVLESLAGQSDDPQWQAMFSPRAKDLRDRASANRTEADRKDQSIRVHDSLPYSLTPRLDSK